MMRSTAKAYVVIGLVGAVVFGGRESVAQPRQPDSAGGLFPSGRLIAPLIANPREPGFRSSLVRGSSSRDLDALIGITEQGGTFGLGRWTSASGRYALQVDVSGSVSAQFDLGSVRWDLLNSDFTFGFPISLRRGSSAVRLRLYHLSSHLGDEFVRRDSIWIYGDPAPVPSGFRTYHQSYRFESAQLLAQHEWHGWRGYAGLDYFWHRAPGLLDPGMALAGVELIQPLGGRERASRFNAVAALDVTMLEYREWEREWSLRAGIEVGRAGRRRADGRRAALMLEYHDGPAPFGQFAMLTSVRYIGGGLFLTL